MASLASLQEDKAQYLEQMELIQSSLKDDPENAELLKLREELTTMLTLLDESLAELQPTSEPIPLAKPRADAPSPQAGEDKWVNKNHAAIKANFPTDEKEDGTAPLVADYQVNDTVLAKWISGDKSFYPARITSITGSTSARVYIVKFKSYDETETLRAKDIRPMPNKRKADGGFASSATGSTSSNVAGETNTTSETPTSTAVGGVISAAARLYPVAQLANESGSNATDTAGPPKAKKIKAGKELEAGKNKWQNFNSKSKFGKTNKKDSMFRTPEGINARVGFTGSGQAMKKDPTRSRHIYQMNEDLD